MCSSALITLTTDFGAQDSFVAQMKGVVLGIAPAVRLIDLCHDVPAQDIAAGAFILETGYAAFPEGTIHLVVVDPGVGTERRPLLVCTERYTFVAPDNGLLNRVLRKERMLSAHVLQEERYRRRHISATFEGRDVFAPAAAWIARGIEPGRFGPPAGELIQLGPPPEVLRPGRPVRGVVVLVDRFGNVTLDLSVEQLTAWLGAAPSAGAGLRLSTPRGEVSRFGRTYAEAGGADPFLLVNSAGYLEVAVDRGRADECLGLHRGMELQLEAG